MTESSSTIGVACYVRASSLVAPLDATLRTLERLDADDVIDELRVGAWPAKVRLAEPGPHTEAVDRFEEFHAWADRWGVSIRPPFAVETRTSELTGESRTLLITPVQCLAVYVDGSLSEVFPHTTCPADGGRGETSTVQDGLSLLEAHANQAFDVTQTPDRLPSRRADTARRTADPL